MKEGYLSQVVHKICQLIIEYNAIVVLEDLNMGFKRGRQKVELAVYQKFEKMLIDKLNYLVDKNKHPYEMGGLLKALQLTNKFISFTKLGKQSGILFYTQAWNTSKIDPVTGFVNLFDTRYETIDKAKQFFSRFDDIRFNNKKNWFEFDFDYNNFTNKAKGSITKWTICSVGDRIKSHRDPTQNNHWTSTRICLTSEFKDLFNKYKEEIAPLAQKVREAGGLFIIGTERHESRRIDNQLRGRSGRQGDPGRTQFCISLEDELMRLFGGERMQSVVNRLGVEEDEPIEAGMITRSIEGAQKKVEGRNFGIRKYVLQYDNVMNKQREIIYGERKKVLFGEDLREDIMNMTHDLIDEVVEPVTVASKFAEEWEIDRVNEGLKRIAPAFQPIVLTEEQLNTLDGESFKQLCYDIFEDLYRQKEEEIGIEHLREAERMILIRVVDNKWMDHIDAMDQLKSGIGLRALGQQDPAAAYAQEGFDMFELMIQSIKEDTVKFCYNVTVETRTERKNILGSGQEIKEDFVDDGPAQGGGEMPAAQQIPEREKKKPETYRREQPKVGRNDPCPCGSGKKYKQCCGKNA
mgnify:CR=1 FL=1